MIGPKNSASAQAKLIECVCARVCVYTGLINKNLCFVIDLLLFGIY